MNSATLHQKVLPSLLGGTSRHPLPGAVIDEPLGLLSLMGQALRFERPATLDSFSVEPEIEDDRKIIADRLRRPLIRVGDIREFFPTPVVQIVQRDAFERLNLKALMLEPEFLSTLEADVHLVADLIALRGAIPG